MTRLIVTTDSSIAGAIQQASPTDRVIAIECRLVWGQLPSVAEFDAFFAPRTTQPQGLHWLDDTPPWRLDEWDLKGHGLIELLSECSSAELWIGQEPNAQLLMLWLLDHCRSVDAALSKLVMRRLDAADGAVDPRHFVQLKPPIVRLTHDHLELAGRAWRAYRAPTPQAWFDLLKTDESLFPQLERSIVNLLEELPSITTGLGATETRILELAALGNARPFDVFPGHQKRNERRVFDYWEVGTLLDGLVRCPVPVVSGLEEGPFTLEMHNDAIRHARYKQSRLLLTELGRAVLSGEEDFLRHNPIHRWWGGSLLTNERLWRWDSRRRMLVAPA
ncbi:hypothetical protein [Bradyrhizobium sp. BR 10289]|uniref:hypothetical protein n=1 Tax=Bradyrhizobium sp. BR 10289 TaxID=2749993 RepID=UPI001C652223|nr:hypothetical protein [Bradyrhizobium sp. BR 10289]MBW7973058.1 hypothetical protein [Bradyrhizobium sp. BR 10289]